jgi:hypothetical protein
MVSNHKAENGTVSLSTPAVKTGRVMRSGTGLASRGSVLQGNCQRVSCALVGRAGRLLARRMLIVGSGLQCRIMVGDPNPKSVMTIITI